MAFTQTDLSSVCAAIASGELTARIGDRQVTYRSVAELLMAKQVIEQDLAAGGAGATPRTGVFRVSFSTARGM